MPGLGMLRGGGKKKLGKRPGGRWERLNGGLNEIRDDSEILVTCTTTEHFGWAAVPPLVSEVKNTGETRGKGKSCRKCRVRLGGKWGRDGSAKSGLRKGKGIS